MEEQNPFGDEFELEYINLDEETEAEVEALKAQEAAPPAGETDAAPAPSSGKKKKKKKKKKKGSGLLIKIWSTVQYFLIIFLAVFILTQLVICNATIPSGSMEETIMTGSRVIGFRLSYLTEDPERGDIVIFQYPLDDDVLYIKRVIGLPGETVEISEGKIYIDGSDTPLEEDYLFEEWVNANDGFCFEVPEDCYLMLGDNRNNSADSRYWAQYALLEGLAETEEEAQAYSYVHSYQIVAKALFVYWPVSEWKLLT